MGSGAYVLIDEVQATIVRDKGGNLLAVLDKLGAHAFPNSGVGLFGLNTTVTKPNVNRNMKPEPYFRINTQRAQREQML